MGERQALSHWRVRIGSISERCHDGMEIATHARSLELINDLPPGLKYIPPKTAIVERLTVEATSYCDHGTTATGTQVAPGTVAVRPGGRIALGRYLRLSSVSYYYTSDHLPDHARAEIDIWSASCDKAWDFGRQHIVAEILGSIPVKHLHERKPRHRSDPDYTAPLPKSILAFEFILIGAAMLFAVIVGRRYLA